MSVPPPGWDETRLGEVLAALLDFRGRTPKKLGMDWGGGSIPALSALNVRMGSIDLSRTSHFGSDALYERWMTTGDPARGDIVLTMEAPLGNVAQIPDDRRYILSQRVVLLKTKQGVNPTFLAHQMRAPEFRTELLANATGTTATGIRQSRLVELPVRIAPTLEQKRIADKLDALLARVDSCRERLDRIPTILKRFRQSVLAAATSGELTREWRGDVISRRGLPTSWQERSIGEVGKVQLGRQRSPKFHAGSAMRPYLRVQNVFEDRLDLSDIMYMDFPGEDALRYELQVGDILLNEGQSPQYLGRPAMYRGELPGACFTNTLIRFQANRSLVRPEYALIVFRHHMHSGRYASEGNITTNIAHLGAGRFAAVEFPIPPLPEQGEIVRRTSLLLGLAEAVEERVNRCLGLLAKSTPAALFKAFRGELVPQDPNDEPASELLARLRRGTSSSSVTTKPKRGGTRSTRTKAKVEDNMLTRKDVADNHLSKILKERGALTAEALWSASQLEIDDFYEQLKDEEARGLLYESRGNLPTAPRLLEPAA